MTSAPSNLDRFLPEFDATTIEQTVAAAESLATFEAIDRADLASDPALGIVGNLRGLPERIAHWRLGIEEPARERRTFADGLGPELGWIPLADEPGVEKIVGIVVRFSLDDRSVEHVQPADFVGFDAPGFVKVALSLTTRATGGGKTVLACEVRARATDEGTRTMLVRSWPVAGGAVRLLVRRGLGTIRAEAEEPGPDV